MYGLDKPSPSCPASCAFPLIIKEHFSTATTDSTAKQAQHWTGCTTPVCIAEYPFDTILFYWGQVRSILDLQRIHTVPYPQVLGQLQFPVEVSTLESPVKLRAFSTWPFPAKDPGHRPTRVLRRLWKLLQHSTVQHN